MNKIGQYFNTFDITRGLLIAFLLSAFIYLHYFNVSIPLINTLLGISGLSLLLASARRSWFWSGAFVGVFWFWWIILSFKHYQMPWAIPVGLLVIAFIYGMIFWTIAYLSEKLSSRFTPRALVTSFGRTLHSSPEQSDLPSSLLALTLKALGLLSLSYIHPLGFDWLKPELVFVESHLGIEKWQFALILFALVMTRWLSRPYSLLLVLLAYQPLPEGTPLHDNPIQIISTAIPVEEKWQESRHPQHFQGFFEQIDRAIDANKTLVVLPESVFPVYINRSQELIDELEARAQKIAIVTGGLFADGTVPHNSAYIFTKDRILVANKVVLVPFGESNPLPDFLSNWVNEVFYDGAVDYVASAEITDYTVRGKVYRNAICFEATSETLYRGRPEQMIVLSNNGWFVPSTEPSLQKLLLLYYNKKYGTTIYHSINMSPSYLIRDGMVMETE
ncbi:apolipoprotein N-acyltransferase [Sulfurovum sp.]|jgi:apolipoprotein N-acyltransferase|uniref:apolipoprotein N-acyltransferase n=1 Tax=Sulfurovum sp. TaxID=1969726 RepID=UPI002A35D901|nr:apolipoprotein N-acyltransferase [Sulfurovum sp.]MDD2450732.1 apolipoprotein N-acyltransferase [Sulfurovum sp.]MDD3499323.1 apolipoprotein N-acyltransferase [Sulfurovum sp.]MDY0403106.1 apolipoprotein N-acyltransferase [Sulfurovum sp.]